MTKRENIQIIYRPLGRHRALGLAYTDSNLIEIDSRLKGKEKYYILVHELVHMYYPVMEEEDVIDLATFLTNYSWEEILSDPKHFIENEGK